MYSNHNEVWAISLIPDLKKMWDYLVTKAFFFHFFLQNLLVWQLVELAELAALAKPCNWDRNVFSTRAQGMHG